MNLLYLSVSLDKSQLQYLQIFLFSLKLFSEYSAYDILVMTSEDFVGDIDRISKQLDIPLKHMIIDVPTREAAYVARYRIFDYPNIHKYTKLLYCDTDILIQGNIGTLFGLDIDDKLYAVAEHPVTIARETHGGPLFDFTVVDRTIIGRNSGLLLYKNTNTVKTLFRDVLKEIADNRDKILTTELHHGLIDQAVLNYYAVTQDLFGPNILNQNVQLCDSIQTPISPLTNRSIMAVHFYGGGAQPKILRMGYHMSYLIDNIATIVPCKKDTTAMVKYRQYTWGSGNILFDVNHLTTSWGRGTYACINDRLYVVSWSGILHIILFNETFTNFISIRRGDTNYGFSEENTAFRDSVPIISTYRPVNMVVGERALIYFCVFYNQGYIDLLNYLFASYKIFSKANSQLDFLVFTSEAFRERVEGLAADFNLQIAVKILDINSMIEAGCARLRIFEYEHINNYNKIMYLDTDIIIQGDIMTLFDCLKEDKLYARQEYDIAGTGHGALFFDFTQFPPTTPSLNTGTLLFRNSHTIRQIFHDIKEHMGALRQRNSLWPDCMDQSFIAYHFIKNGACDLVALGDLVCLAEHTFPPVKPSPIVIGHFIWPIGNPAHKLGRMKTHLAKLLE